MSIHRKRHRLTRQQTSQLVSDALHNPLWCIRYIFVGSSLPLHKIQLACYLSKSAQVD
jgi:hypothetical protein